MTEPPDRELALFDAARKLPAAERTAYLDRACAADPALHQRVEALIRAHELAGTFMESPAQPLKRETIRLELCPSEKAGDQIGRYKLLQQIGEGGCGVVYMAEQEQPVKRRVALKVIKLGMDTRSVIARFSAERQALALMDHPNIAKVLDAGATETGRPYFVMELVRGIKITDYCDQNNLSTKARLDLFMQVCRAVQHAHQKGIIHRDIKPSNILVTMTDGVPTPKVIDFGIAKATQGKLTDDTLFTAFEQFIGTPAYMSPEQAEMSALDIDTRSDIYSLGVLLYELLTGKTPFDAKELLKAGLDEMRRRIREQEPSRPSTRLSTMMAADLTTIAAHRQAQPPKLIHLVSGDLDWIVMKALEKDRTRRYDTANGFAADIQRHLDNEPVLASPPGAGYKLRKFVRRHRVGVMAGSFVLLALVAGIIGTTWGLLDALHQKREAERQGKIAKHTTDFLTGMFESIDPETAKLRDITVREILDQAGSNISTAFPGDPMTELPIRRTLLDIYQKLGKPDAAIIHAQAALNLVQSVYGDKDSLEKAASLDDLANCLDAASRSTEALPMHEAALAMDRRINKGDNPEQARDLTDLAECLYCLDHITDALTNFDAALTMNRRLHKEGSPDISNDTTSLANCLQQLGRDAEALTNYQAALAINGRIYKGDHPDLALNMQNIGYCLDQMGLDSEALTNNEAALAMFRRIYNGDHPNVANCIFRNAEILLHVGRFDEALTNYDASWNMYQRIYKGDFYFKEIVLNSYALTLDTVGRSEEALPKYEECVATCERLYPDGHAETCRALNNYALCLQHLGRWDGALTNYETALAMLHRLEKWESSRTAIIQNHVGESLHFLGRLDEARQQYEEALAILMRISIAQPDDNAVRMRLASTRQNLGDVLAEMGKIQEATTNYQSGLQVAETVLASDAANPAAKTMGQTFRIKLGLDKADIVVSKIAPHSQAFAIGLKTGDVLVRYAGKPVGCSADLPVLTGRASGAGVNLEIIRDGTPLEFTVKPGPLGVQCEDRVLPGKDSP